MAKNYTVISGDTLTKIANQHGFADWRVIYNDPSNATFKAKRPNPDKIFPTAFSCGELSKIKQQALVQDGMYVV